MFSINGTTITLTRGDTLVAQIEIKRNDETYTPVEGDSLRIAVKHPELNADKTDYLDAEPLIDKEIPIETQVLRLESSDTKNLGFGKYAYDIQITFADGWVDTFISGILILTKEVD